MDRRTWLATLAAALVAPCSRAAPAPRVRAGVALQFPRDHGALSLIHI